MVTIERLLPYSYWIGHPVTNRAIIYPFVGFIPLSLKEVKTLQFIVKLNTAKWELKYQRKRLGHMRPG
uniref:ORF2p protein n=1 Tax=Coxsackievirus B3 (strain Nancy) TaxID=103903 RepID=ORF2P_CXB3N|nr:RecName: Full=ORF2p protein [Coxsackievirus B3 (strain Nancy)]